MNHELQAQTMKRYLIIFLALAELIIAGCDSVRSSTPMVTTMTRTFSSDTPSPLITITATPTPITSTRTPISPTTDGKEQSPTATLTPTLSFTPTPTFPPETNLSVQCLEVLTELPTYSNLDGKIVLNSLLENETILLDISTGRSFSLNEQNEVLHGIVTSTDRKSIAFESHILDSDRQVVKEKLVVSSADGERQKELPWEERWEDILTFLDDQRLMIQQRESNSIGENEYPFSFLAINPFSGERIVMKPNYPGFLDKYYLQIDWDGWEGFMYSPTLQYVIYPQIIQGDDEFFTFALWDVIKQQQVASFEDIYRWSIYWSAGTEMPRWFHDGSKFGMIANIPRDEKVEIELFQISQDGKVEQLTHLTPVAGLWGLTYSWSPKGDKIAMNLYTLYDLQYTWYDLFDGTHVAVLDLDTQAVTDYCIPIRGVTKVDPIWSPDGNQFLVVDAYAENHQSVILVDITQGYAVQIAEDMMPMGWLVSEK
jgi:hypothetical protein